MIESARAIHGGLRLAKSPRAEVAAVRTPFACFIAAAKVQSRFA